MRKITVRALVTATFYTNMGEDSWPGEGPPNEDEENEEAVKQASYYVEALRRGAAVPDEGEGGLSVNTLDSDVEVVGREIDDDVSGSAG